MKLIYLFSITALATFLFSCANVKAPTGGPKDEEPPRIIYGTSHPDSLHLTNFSGKKIWLEFDELIEVQNLSQNLIISPPHKSKFKHTIKPLPGHKSRLTITFEEAFKDNTTYTLNFGSAIKDVTEKNVLPNPTLAFSTGPVMDSLEIRGTVEDALTTDKLEGIKVALYPIYDTTNFTEPLYFTTTEASGRFKLQNLKNENFYIRAFQDDNNNNQYDEATERIAFQKDYINPTDANRKTLRLFAQDNRPPKIQSIKPYLNEYQISFDEPVLLKTEKNNNSTISTLSLDGTVLSIHAKHQLPTGNFRIEASDSNNNILDTILTLEPISNEALQISSESVISKTQTFDNQYFKTTFQIEISTNFPLQSSRESNILYATVRDTVQLTEIATNSVTAEPNSSSILIAIGKTKKDTFSIILQEAALTTIQDSTNKETTFTFYPGDQSKYGRLSGNLSTPLDNYVLQLVNPKNEIVRQTVNTSTFDFTLLPPSTYKFRLIHDIDKNQQWSPGNLDKSLQPESVYYLGQPFKLKANWEIQNVVLTHTQEN